MANKSKGAIIGFKGVHLAPILEDSLTKYETGAAISVPFAGSMTRNPKESTGELYYDDEPYAKVDELLGEEVEMNFGEISFETLVALGYGKLTGEVLDAPLAITPKEYSLRCETATVGGFSQFFKWRKFTLSSIRVGNLKTKSTGAEVAEVTVKGLIGKPVCPLTVAVSRTRLKEDLSNLTACQDFLTKAEVVE